MTTHLLVGNPTAQSGRNAERIDQALSHLADEGLSVELLATLPAGRSIDAVAEALDKGAHECVIAMGGDGTFREVASGLLASSRKEQVAMAMLPTGTANDQGRSFGLSADPADLPHNVAVIAQAKETRLDAGRIQAIGPNDEVLQDSFFFDSAGWGISASVLAARNQDRQWVEKTPLLSEVYRDHVLYAGALLRTFLESYIVSEKFSAVVLADTIRYEFEDLTDLILKGTRIYGGAWVFDQRSKHDDGVFEAVPFRSRRDWTSKALVDLDGNVVTEEMLNAIGIEHSRPFRGSHFDITLEPQEEMAELHAQIDGEEFPATTRTRVDVLPRAIRLIVP